MQPRNRFMGLMWSRSGSGSLANQMHLVVPSLSHKFQSNMLASDDMCPNSY